MFFKKAVWQLLALSIFAFPFSVIAENSSVLVEGDLGRAFAGFGRSAVRSLSSRPTSFQAFDPLTLSVQLPDGRTIALTLNENLKRYWPAYFVSDYGVTEDNADVVLFRGESNDGTQVLPLAGSIYMHEGRPTLFFDFPSSDGHTFYKLSVPLVEGGASVAAVLETHDSSELEHMSCAAEGEHLQARSARTGSDTVGTLSLRALEIATEADFEYFSDYGTETNAHIASVMNAADTIYQRDLNIDIRISSQHAMTSSSQPYTSTNASTLLSQFQTYTNTNHQLGSADLFHMFTGKEIDGSTIGIAYLDVTCSSPSYSYGFSQDVGSLSYLVFAHEVGHNLGADHDTSGAVTIMAPVLNSAATSFSALSISAINAYLNVDGFCLASVDNPDSGGSDPTPTPTPTPQPTPEPRSAAVSLGASFDQGSNRLSIVVEASDVSASDCRAYVRIASDATMVSGRTAAWGKKGSTIITGSGKNKKRTSGLLYVQASYACPSLGVQLFSDVQSISPVVVSGNQKLTTDDKWIKSSLKDAAKNANKRQNNH